MRYWLQSIEKARNLCCTMQQAPHKIFKRIWKTNLCCFVDRLKVLMASEFLKPTYNAYLKFEKGTRRSHHESGKLFWVNYCHLYIIENLINHKNHTFSLHLQPSLSLCVCVAYRFGLVLDHHIS